MTDEWCNGQMPGETFEMQKMVSFDIAEWKGFEEGYVTTLARMTLALTKVEYIYSKETGNILRKKVFTIKTPQGVYRTNTDLSDFQRILEIEGRTVGSKT